jgi:hypothetical protein
MHENLSPFEYIGPDLETELQTAAFQSLLMVFPNIPLYPALIPNWRGAVIEIAGKDKDIFHNHQPEDDAYHHRPALIQYRVKGGCAALWGMNQGVEALQQWYADAPDKISIAGQYFPAVQTSILREKHRLQITPEYHYYRIHDYLALNPENYQKWLNEPRFIARAEILQGALTGHLLAFCQAADWWLSDHLKVDLVEIHKYKKTRYHDTNLLAFEITYRCNLLLPDEIALGKAVSHGFGVQRRAPMF